MPSEGAGAGEKRRIFCVSIRKNKGVALMLYFVLAEKSLCG